MFRPAVNSTAQAAAANWPLQGTAVQVGSIQLQVAYAPGNLPAIVLIHGGLGSRRNWYFQWEFCRSLGQAVLAYDLAGHGESGRYSRYSVGRHCRDLQRLLQQLKITAPILCCHSYGVPIGLEWASSHHTTALIAIGGGTHDLTPWWEIPLIKLFALGGHHLYHSNPVQQAIRGWRTPDADHLQQFHAQNLLPADVHPYEAISAFWGYDGRHQPISCPVVIITGAADVVFPPSMGHRWLAQLTEWHPDSHHIVVDQTGHLVMAEAPAVVNQAILSQLSPSALAPN